jgi:hypothetical protein
MNTPTAGAVSGATLRQLDYWSRLGIFGGKARAGGGSGTQRQWDEVAVVLLRALVYLGTLCGSPRYRRMVGAEEKMRGWAATHDGHFTGCWLVVNEFDVLVVPASYVWAHPISPAAVVIDLGACQQYVNEVQDQLSRYLLPVHEATG